jgi:hypothetical protein
MIIEADSRGVLAMLAIMLAIMLAMLAMLAMAEDIDKLF